MSDKRPLSHVLEFRAVVKRFHSVSAVNGVSFSLHRSEVFTLLGPSGCGKTTTLRLVAGLEEPDEGEILIDGETVAAPDRGLFVPPDKRRLGMVFQSYAIWPHLSVFENVAFPLRVRRQSADELRQRVHQVLEIVGLAGFEERGATQLSGGQQQRVALARALVYEPSILLLDEPLSNLDAKLREQMRGEIRTLQRKLGLTVLYVTHDQAEAMTLSDRVAVVNGGRFEQIGTPEDVYETPATSFVAEFLGRVVSFRGIITKTSAGCWIEFANDAGRCGLSGTVTDSLTDGALAKVTTRPENIEICAAAGPGPNQLAATIEEVAYLGERFEYQVSAAGSSFVLVAPKKQRFRPGDIVHLVLDPARVNVRPD